MDKENPPSETVCTTTPGFPATIDALFSEMSVPGAFHCPTHDKYNNSVVALAYALVHDTVGVQSALSATDLDITHLRQRLETLGHLCGMVCIKDHKSLPGWLVTIARESPTREDLQARSYAELDTFLATHPTGDDGDDAVARQAVITTWAQGRSLREALVSEEINLQVVDFLERSQCARVSSPSELKQEHIDQLLHGGPGQPRVSLVDLKRLAALYRRNASEYSGTQRIEQAKVEARRAATVNAETKVHQLLNEAKIGSKTHDQLRKEIQAVSSDIVSSLASIQAEADLISQQSTWASGITDHSTAIQALERAKTELASTNREIQAALSSRQQERSDEDIIATVGAGSALNAIPFGLPLNCNTQCAPHPVLCKPEFCRLRNPEVPFTVSHEEFNNEQSATIFQSVAESIGYSLATSLKASGWELTLDSGSTPESRAQWRQQEKATKRTSASVAETLSVPVNTFCIPETQMVLNSEALARARTIKGIRQGRDFLNDFYSHIPSSTITIGGTFSRNVTVTVTESTGAQAICNKAMQSLKIDDGAGGAYGFTSQIAVSASTFPDLDGQGRETESQRDCTIRTYVRAYGPNVFSADAFVAQLLSSPNTWRIIDRGPFHTLIPVWDLMLRHSEDVVQAAGRFVRQAWLQMAEDQRDIPTVLDAINQTRAAVQRDTCIQDLFGDGLPHFQLPEPSGNGVCASDLAVLQVFVQQCADVIVSAQAQNGIDNKQWDQQAAQAILRAFMAIHKWASFLGESNLLFKFLEPGQPLATAVQICGKLCSPSEDGTAVPSLYRFSELRRALFACISEPQQVDLQRNDTTSPLFRNPIIEKLFLTRNHEANASPESDWFAQPVESGNQLVEILHKLLYDQLMDHPMVAFRVERTLVWNLCENSRFASTSQAIELKHLLQNKFGFFASGFQGPLSKMQMEHMLDEMKCYLAGFGDCDDNLYPPNESGSSKKVANEQNLTVTWFCQHEVSSFAEKFLVDRPLALLPDLEDHELIDVLVHRLAFPTTSAEPPSSSEEVTCNAESDETQSEDDLFASESNTPLTPPSTTVFTSPHERMCKMLSQCDEVSQSYIASTLLHRRCAVPLVISGHALDNVETLLLEGNTSVIVSDQELMRVALVSLEEGSSRQTPSLVKVLGCDTLTAYGVGTCSIAELGYGWLSQKSSSAEERPPIPLILSHIVGNSKYEEMKNRLHELFDVVLFELSSSPPLNKSFTPQGTTPWPARFIFWTPKPPFSKSKETHCKGVKVNNLQGLVTDELTTTIKQLLRDTCKDRNNLGTQMLQKQPVRCRNPLSFLFVPTQVPPTPTTAAPTTTTTKTATMTTTATTKPVPSPSSTLALSGAYSIAYMREILDTLSISRDQSLPLHKYFRDQVAAMRQNKNPLTSIAHRTEASRHIQDCFSKRVKIVNQLDKLPVLSMFESILQRTTASDRVNMYLMLDRLLEEHCNCKGAGLLTRRSKARQQYQEKVSKSVPASELHLAEQERQKAEVAVAESVVAPEHLFREMACMYEAVQVQIEKAVICQPANHEGVNRYAKFPMMAALHLLDGFPIELVDGDCSWANGSWLKAVMSALQVAIHQRHPELGVKPTRVFVLSILGVQKSGKSSLLNVMFGCRFRTSVTRCTRGLNMQLIRCERQDTKFKYLLVLDTEGVRSPDLHHTDNALLHDNRLAVYAVWLADATLVLVNGNQSNDSRDVLSIVKYISDRSTGNLGRLTNRLFFAMRSISKAQGMKVVDEVRAILFNDVSKALELASTLSGQNPNDFLTDFVPEKDIFILGNITKSDRAPDDVPDSHYGLDVSNLRERIHERCCMQAKFKSRSLARWTEHFLKAQDEILEMESVMVYQCADARVALEKLGDELGILRCSVSKAYVVAFENVQSNFVALVDGEPGTRGMFLQATEKAGGNLPEKVCQELIRLLDQHIAKQIQEEAQKANQQFELTISPGIYNNFRDSEKGKWENFLFQQTVASSERVRNLVMARKFFKIKVEEYKQQIVYDTKVLCQQHPLKERKDWSDTRKEEEFTAIFDRVEQRASTECKPLHNLVETNVWQVYRQRCGIIKDDVITPTYSEEIESSKASHASSAWCVFLPRLRKIFSGDSRRSELEIEGVQRLFFEVMAEVKRLLKDHTVYSDAAVEMVIQKTDALLIGKGEYRFAVKSYIHNMARQEVTRILLTKQCEWDSTNSIPGLIASSKVELRQFFLDTINGLEVQARLKKYLVETIRNSFWMQHLSLIVHRTANLLREQELCQQGFVMSYKVLQNLADYDLLTKINDNSALKKALSDPQSHYDEVMTQRIMVFLKKHYTDNSDLVNLRNLICSSLHTAAQQAAHIDPSTNSGVCPGRSQKFFTVLRSSLQGLGFLEDRLPDPENASAMFNIDSCGLVELQDIAAHVEESLPYESLPSVTHTPFCIGRIADGILQRLRDAPVTETFRLRCKELCPMCRIRCAHPSGDGHSGLHMSAHQPGGLGGTHECVSLMIDPDSCLQSAAKNATIRLSGSDKRVPFRDFTTAFPTWEVPPWNQPAPIPMLVRQYIFFHKQDLLHEMHPHTVKCLDRMPKSYNCDLELLRSTIRAELERDGVQDLDSI